MRKSGIFGSVKRLALAAMLTAMSVVIGIFCKTVLNFADGLFRITFENLPIILGGIMFGPIIGALIGATGIVSKEVVIESLSKKFKEKSPKIMELNIAAIEKGIELGSRA